MIGMRTSTFRVSGTRDGDIMDGLCLLIIVLAITGVFVVGYLVFLWFVTMMEDAGSWLNLDPDEPKKTKKT